MRSYTAGTAHRRSGVFPYVELWEQPFLRWMVARAYHLWEKHTEPAMRHISEWHKSMFSKSDEYVPLLNRRDIRCYRLEQAGRTTIAISYITQDQYDVITGKAPKQELRHEVKEPIAIEE